MIPNRSINVADGNLSPEIPKTLNINLPEIKRKQTNITTKMFTPVFNYLSYDRKNLVITIKHRIYKQKLMQLQA